MKLRIVLKVFILIGYIPIALISYFLLLNFIDINVQQSWLVDTEKILLLCFIMAGVSVGFYFYSNYKEKGFLRKSRNQLIILYSSFLLSTFFSLQFGNTSWWYLKYLGIVFFIFLCYFFLPNYRGKSQFVFVIFGVIILALFSDQIEYMKALDPSDYPSILYIDSHASLLQWILHFGAIIGGGMAIYLILLKFKP